VNCPRFTGQGRRRIVVENAIKFLHFQDFAANAPLAPKNFLEKEKFRLGCPAERHPSAPRQERKIFTDFLLTELQEQPSESRQDIKSMSNRPSRFPHYCIVIAIIVVIIIQIKMRMLVTTIFDFHHCEHQLGDLLLRPIRQPTDIPECRPIV
jgi:hypothetical protein